MKIKQKVFSALLISFAMMLTNCSNNLNSIPGSLTLKASSTASNLLLKAPALNASEMVITSAVVQIKNLVIEDNTGEDQGDSNVEDNNVESEIGNLWSDGGDILLAGAYNLDILNTSVVVDNVSALPGIYKKVDFDFLQGTGNEHSIIIAGTYNNNGVDIPFSLLADLSSTIQLPLANNGLIITSNISSSISIIFDINSWMKDLNLATAIVKDNVITISATENKALYEAFIVALNANIDVEED